MLNGSDVAGWALVAPRAENGTVSKISNQIIFSQCVIGFCGSCWKLFFDLGRVEKQLEWRALRCISGLVRTGKSGDDADIDPVLLIAALATGGELESSVHLLWLAQETSRRVVDLWSNSTSFDVLLLRKKELLS